MKSPIRNCRHYDRGSLLISAAVASAIIAILIGGMLTYISNEYRLNLRSHRWTQGLYLAEAGVDMAFAEYNNYYVTNTASAFNSSRGWVDEGWDGYGKSYSRNVSSFTNAAGETVGSISNRIERVGTYTPYVKAFACCTTTPNGPLIYRGVKCHLRTSSSFPAGMVAKKKIDTNGKNVYTDSYDSTDVSKSTNYKYDSTKKQAHGDIASNDTITNTLDVTLGNASVYGQVLLSPPGSITMGPGGSVGSSFITRDTTVTAGKTDGSIRNDFQVDIPSATLPSVASGWSSLGSIQNTATITGDHQATSISLSGNGGNNTVYISGTVNLYITGNNSISISGGGGIVVLPGAQLTVYTKGSVSIAGNAIVNNSTYVGSSAPAMNVRLYGLETSTSWSIGGNGYWSGLVYAPYADLTMNGGGANGDMSGAVVANSITMNGQVQFHYDEALRHSNIFGSYDIASWRSMHRQSSTWVNDY